MSTIAATGEVFRSSGKQELHVAPEGIALTERGRVVGDDAEQFYADYQVVESAASGGTGKGWLEVRFLDGSAFHGRQPVSRREHVVATGF